MTTPDNTVIITANKGFSENQLRNFYFTNGFQGFGWMLFHFSVVYFFTALLNNLAMVGIFLAFSNAVSFCLDIPLGILQRYISTKKFFIIGAISQLVAIGIFFFMIINAFSIVQAAVSAVPGETTKAVTDWFFGNLFNPFLLLIAAFCYGLTKEINEVSTFGYILSNSNPSEYGVILSRSNITFGIGSLIGLILSGVLLSMHNVISLFILGGIIFAFMVFTIKYFDNTAESITLDNVKNFTISMKKMNVENIKEHISETISKTDLSKVVENTKYLFLKPKTTSTNQKIPWKEVYTSTLREFRIIWEIISHTPTHFGLIWGLILVLIFGFWDTFASSFLVDYLDGIKTGWGYILLAVIGVPGIVLQEVAIKLGAKIGDMSIGILGLVLSGGSLIVMGILAMGSAPSAFAIIAVALVNSLGYACGMAIGQNAFLDLYNKIYAEHEKLKEIDANASAGPMKVIQNLANVIGLGLGGALVGLGFGVFFILFALIVIATLVWSIMNKKKIVL